MVVAGLVTVALIATVLFLVIAVDRGRGDTSGAGGDTDRRVSGDRDEWVAAVCEEGSLTPPASANFRFPAATDVAYCAARAADPGSAPESIMVAQWPSHSAVGEELSKFPAFRQFAAGPVEGGTVVFAPVASADRSLLEPLTAFGFAIVALP